MNICVTDVEQLVYLAFDSDRIIFNAAILIPQGIMNAYWVVVPIEKDKEIYLRFWNFYPGVYEIRNNVIPRVLYTRWTDLAGVKAEILKLDPQAVFHDWTSEAIRAGN